MIYSISSVARMYYFFSVDDELFADFQPAIKMSILQKNENSHFLQSRKESIPHASAPGEYKKMRSNLASRSRDFSISTFDTIKPTSRMWTFSRQHGHRYIFGWKQNPPLYITQSRVASEPLHLAPRRQAYTQVIVEYKKIESKRSKTHNKMSTLRLLVKNLLPHNTITRLCMCTNVHLCAYVHT